MKKYRMPNFKAVYVNSKEFTIQKGFATEAAMNSWLAKHAVTIVFSGPNPEKDLYND
jgi:hypothetical protein